VPNKETDVESGPGGTHPMKVSIKSFDVDMDVKNKGIEFEVYDNDGTHLGDVILTKKYVIWCKGKTGRDNGIRFKWEEFIERMEQE
jgi:hypothetical protein